MKLNTRTSIIDWMKSKKLDSSFNTRADLYEKLFDEKYTSSPRQNIILLKMMKEAGTPKQSGMLTPPPTEPVMQLPVEEGFQYSKPAQDLLRYMQNNPYSGDSYNSPFRTHMERWKKNKDRNPNFAEEAAQLRDTIANWAGVNNG